MARHSPTHRRQPATRVGCWLSDTGLLLLAFALASAGCVATSRPSLDGTYRYDPAATAVRLVQDGFRTPDEVARLEFPRLELTISGRTLALSHGPDAYTNVVRLHWTSQTTLEVVYRDPGRSMRFDVVGDGIWVQDGPGREWAKYRRLE